METMTDSVRPLENPADLTGNTECCPDAPTELPDKPEGMEWQDGKQRVEEVQSRKVEVSRVSREGMKGMEDVNDDGRGPGKLHEPSDNPPDIV